VVGRGDKYGYQPQTSVVSLYIASIITIASLYYQP